MQRQWDVETVGRGGDFEQTGPAELPAASHAQPTLIRVISGDSSLLDHALHQNPFRQLKGGIKALPESFGPRLSSAQICLQATVACSGETCSEPLQLKRSLSRK